MPMQGLDTPLTEISRKPVEFQAWKDKDKGPPLQENGDAADRQMVRSQAAGPGECHPEGAAQLPFFTYVCVATHTDKIIGPDTHPRSSQLAILLIMQPKADISLKQDWICWNTLKFSA